MGRCVRPPADRDQPNRSHVHAEAAPGRGHERDLYRHRNEAETAGRQSSAEKDLDPNAAATPTRSPATFAAVPTSSVRSALTPGGPAFLPYSR